MGLSPWLYYYRDNHQNEVDVIFKQGAFLTPIEIKSSETFNAKFLKGLHFYKKLVGDKMHRGFMVYAGQTTQEIGDINVINFKHAARIVQKI